ncbi:TVP38/TMEM64 family protein [Thermoanaerobacterium sp. RBIITD]|uniref:TVP38/TMEM64 family protein n=1 Tax=Thermoanaerobacterium sp. RBIITD TaxID=1550240 RepID=UPI000BB7B74C|nr:TVP38/TMEM64 family protein [Thermoanaerobacterium sp. RBIITD]SNX53098.1 Uncharacterized membrane protein YdjX, TVP38/TMEM64 family, SNARE-associated domain [Thermoanaerobacterium sp. RBIITD]
MKKDKRKLILNGILIIAFIFLFVWILLTYGKDLTYLLKNPVKFERWIKNFGTVGILIFIAIQIIQVVIFVIPGEVVQIAGGYLYGTFFGSIYSIVGITIGSLICFIVARLLGFDFVRNLLSEEKLNKFDYIINNEKGEFVLFLLFFLPGLPKDALSYIAGLTPVKFINFFIITLIARLPGIVISAYIGANLEIKNYTIAIIISIIAILLFTIGLYNKDKVMKKLRDYNK